MAIPTIEEYTDDLLQQLANKLQLRYGVVFTAYANIMESGKFGNHTEELIKYFSYLTIHFNDMLCNDSMTDLYKVKKADGDTVIIPTWIEDYETFKHHYTRTFWEEVGVERALEEEIYSDMLRRNIEGMGSLIHLFEGNFNESD